MRMRRNSLGHFVKRNGAAPAGATRSEVRSPTSTRTEVRSPTRTSTSTEAYTQGNITVTGGAGAGATTSVIVRKPPRTKRRRNGTPRPSGRYSYGAGTLDVKRLEALQDARFRRARQHEGQGNDDAKLIALEKAVLRRYYRAQRHGSIPPMPRPRRNGGPKGAAKIAPLMKAASRSRNTRRFLALQGAGTRRILVGIKRGELKSALRNPGSPGRYGNGVLYWGRPRGAAKTKAMRAALSRALRVSKARGGASTAAGLRAFRRAERLGGATFRRRNPSSVTPTRNPKRKKAPMARRRRTAAQRAAFRRMIAGLRRSKRGGARKRRRNPRRKGSSMARRRTHRRRRNPAVMANPRRRRRSSGRRRMHHRRRRNPGTGAGIKGALKSVFMTAIPALGGGFVANFIDAKFLADKNIVIRILAKVAQAAAAGMLFRKRPVIAYATMGAIIGSVGGDFGTRMAGGAIVGATPVAKAQGVAALITEDPRTMGVLVEGMRGMGYAIDSNVSLGDPSALPAGSYQDVNLG